MERNPALILPKESSLAAWQEWLETYRHKTALGPHHVQLESVDDEHMTISMPVGDHARQPYGLLHGGMSMMLAESAASLHACWKVDLTSKVPVGIEINGSHLKSATGGVVLATATQIRRSSTLAHHEVRITQQETGRLLSLIRVTNMYKPV